MVQAALRLPSLAKQTDFLRNSCGSDERLFQEAERRLRANYAVTSDVSLDATVPEPPPPSHNDNKSNQTSDLKVPIASEDQQTIIGQLCDSVTPASEGSAKDVADVAAYAPSNAGKGHSDPSSLQVAREVSGSRYEFQEEIARGGMGAILKGHDTNLGRDLAIKVLLETHKDDAEVVQRFIEEAQIGGQLQHPGIVPVYELGKFTDQRPYFSMKLVKGETLSKKLAQRQDPAHERARFLGIFEQICQTMAYAHSRKVIHRDLKPANIMVGTFGEVQVMDWGLAKVLSAKGADHQSKSRGQNAGISVIHTVRANVHTAKHSNFSSQNSETQLGSVLGTPAYMPPEQALGEIDQLDERADVFGLGAILCEILTGKPPYIGANGTQVFRQAARGNLTDCTKRLDTCGADIELIELTKQCLQLEPADRFRDATVLAERISAYLELVATKLHQAEIERAAQAERIIELRRRRKLHYFIVALLLFGLVSAGFTANHFRSMELTQRTLTQQKAELATRNERLAAEREAERNAALIARDAASRQKELAEDAKARADLTLADMQTARGLQAAKEGDSGVAALWFINAAAATPGDTLRSAANRLRAHNWLNDCILPVAVLQVPATGWRRLAFHPDGIWVLTLNENKLRIWDWHWQEPLIWSEALDDVCDANWSPDGSRLAVSTVSGEVRIVDVTTGQIQHRFRGTDQTATLEWSPDGRRIALGGKGVQVWIVGDVPTCESNWAHPKLVYAVTFNDAGTRIATACDDDLARVFAIGDTSQPAPIFTLDHVPENESRKVNGVAAPVFCDTDSRLVTILKSRQPGWCDAETGKSLPAVWKPSLLNCDRSLARSKDGRRIAIGGFNSAIYWQTDGQDVHVPHANHLSQVIFHPSGQSLLTTCWDRTARLWPFVPNGRPSMTIPQMQDAVNAWFSPDGSHVAIGCNGQAIIWRLVESKEVIGQISSWTDLQMRPRLSFDGRMVTPSVWHEFRNRKQIISKSLTVARTDSGQPAGPPISLAGDLIDSCICADNESVAAATISNSSGLFSVYEIASGKRRFEPFVTASPPINVAARHGKHHVAILCQDGNLLIVDTQRGQLITEIGHDDWNSNLRDVSRVEYSPDGNLLLTVSPTSEVCVRDPDTLAQICPKWNPVIEVGPCRAIAFSKDSRLLATAVNGKNAVQVWELRTGRLLAAPLLHTGDHFGIFSVAFSPDSNFVLTGHKDGGLRLWDWKLGRLVIPPMQNSDEVYEGLFIADGRFAASAIRNSTTQLWDLATGRPVAPPIRYPLLANPSTTSFGITGSSLIASSPGYPIIDLAVLLTEVAPDSDTEMLRLAELATNCRIHLGEIERLIDVEWHERWNIQTTYRRGKRAEAERLVEKLDHASDPVVKQKIAERGLRMNLIELMLELRPNEPDLHLCAAEKSDLEQDEEAALLHRQRAIDEFEKLTMNQTLDESTAKKMALALIRQKKTADLFLLSPIEAISERGVPMIIHSDGSILADGLRPELGESYIIRCRLPLHRLATIRLETMPHPKMPRGGHGWGYGNFHLDEFRAELQKSNGTSVPLQFQTVASSHVRPLDYFTDVEDSAAAVIDGNLTTRWDIYPKESKKHWLALGLKAIVPVDDDDELVVHLDFRDPRYPDGRLGYFRLLASDEELDFTKLQLKTAIESQDISGAAALAAAWLISDQPSRSVDLLKSRLMQTNPTNLLIQALAEQEMGNANSVSATTIQLVKSLDNIPIPRVLQQVCFELISRVQGIERNRFYGLLRQSTINKDLSELRRAADAKPVSIEQVSRLGNYLARVGRWHESAEVFKSVREIQPSRVHESAMAIVSFLLAGEEENYWKECHALHEYSRTVNAPHVAEMVCALSLLRPGTFNSNDLPIDLVRKASQEATWKPLHSQFIACNAFFSLREGKPDEAIEWAQQMPNFDSHSGSLALVVWSMAEAQSGNGKQARELLTRAETNIPKELRFLGINNDQIRLPVSASATVSQWLIVELLRREASDLLIEAANGNSNGKE